MIARRIGERGEALVEAILEARAAARADLGELFRDRRLGLGRRGGRLVEHVRLVVEEEDADRVVRLELLEAVEVLDDGGEGRRGDEGSGTTEGVRLLHKLRPAALYDLKGSSIDRYVKPKRKNAGKTLKDDNLRSHGLQPHGERLPLRTADDRAAALLAQLAADSAFLREVGVMDYSLLLAVFPGGLGDGADGRHPIGSLVACP